MARPTSSTTPAPAIFASSAMGCRTSSARSEEHTSELQSQSNLVCRLLLEKHSYLSASQTLPSFQTASPRSKSSPPEHPPQNRHGTQLHPFPPRSSSALMSLVTRCRGPRHL